MFGNTPIVPPQDVPFDGSGAGYSTGQSPSSYEYAKNTVAGGVPSVFPSAVLSSPPRPFRIGYDETAYQIQPVQGGIPDRYSWRVKAPKVPRNHLPYDEIAYQIFRNGTEIAGGILLSAPRIPTGPAGGSCVRQNWSQNR